MTQIVYYSVTGQTRRFVKKITSSAIEIEPHNPFIKMNEPFILIAPTYPEEMIEPINDFLETNRNINYCRGMFGGGNRNFGTAFCFTVRDLEQEYGVPVLHKFEFQGSEQDVEKLKKEIRKIEHQNN